MPRGLRKPLIVGAAVGLPAGMISYFTACAGIQTCMSAPGVILSIITLQRQSGHVTPFFPYSDGLGNGLFYGGLAALVTWFVTRERHLPPQIPQCVICGFRWPAPTTAKCPQCGRQDSFYNAIVTGVPVFHCQKCGHNLTGNLSQQCPECGEPI